MSKMKAVADHIFSTYPNQTEAFVTSDRRGFLEEHTAEAYAARLQDRRITKFVKGQEEVETLEAPAPGAETIKDTTAALGGPIPDAAPEPNVNDLEVITDEDPDPLGDLKFDELKELATAQGVDITGLRSKADLKAAIAAHQNSNT